jgi:hypothetical protein
VFCIFHSFALRDAHVASVAETIGDSKTRSSGVEVFTLPLGTRHSDFCSVAARLRGDPK